MSKNIEWTMSGKTMTLFPGEQGNIPLIVLNSYSGNGSTVLEEMKKLRCPDCHLLSVGGLNWDHDMAPWDCPPLFKNGDPCTGGADEYLEMLCSEILPTVLPHLVDTPIWIGLAGYSLAGLFALYAMYKTDVFSRFASVSGSLWFPEFLDFAVITPFCGKPRRVYLSLGDKEAKTRQPLMKTVQDNTEALFGHFRKMGLDVKYELNPGNHFADEAVRTAKGIADLLQ